LTGGSRETLLGGLALGVSVQLRKYIGEWGASRVRGDGFGRQLGDVEPGGETLGVGGQLLDGSHQRLKG